MNRPKRQHVVLVLALIGALVVTGLFAMRAVHSARHVRGGAEEIRPWMPIRYIARSHDVPADVLLNALDLTQESPGSRGPLLAIARQQNRPVSDLITALEAAIKRFHAGPPDPPAPPLKPTPVAQRNGS